MSNCEEGRSSRSDSGGFDAQATQASGTRIHQAMAHRLGFNISSARIASHGTTCGVRLGITQAYSTGAPCFNPSPPRSA